jgi:hypothetical protein
VLAQIDTMLEARLTSLVSANMHDSGAMALMQNLDQLVIGELSLLLSIEGQLLSHSTGNQPM